LRVEEARVYTRKTFAVKLAFHYLPKIPRLNSLLGYCVSTTLTLVPTSLVGPAEIGLLNRQYNFYDTNPSGAYCPTYAQFFGQMGVSLSMFLCGA
jgi:hypothetical protein